MVDSMLSRKIGIGMLMLWGRCLFFIGCLLHLQSIPADDMKICKDHYLVPVPWHDGSECGSNYQYKAVLL